MRVGWNQRIVDTNWMQPNCHPAHLPTSMHDNQRAQIQDQTNKTIMKVDLYYPYFDIDFSS